MRIELTPEQYATLSSSKGAVISVPLLWKSADRFVGIRRSGLGEIVREKPHFPCKKPACVLFIVCADRRPDSVSGAAKGVCGGNVAGSANS